MTIPKRAETDAVKRFLQDRLRINERLFLRVSQLFEEKYFVEQVLDCLRPGRRIRGIIFSQILLGLGNTILSAEVIDTITAIELAHAASILVDDVLDGDDMRHGVPVIERWWGQSKAILFAHLLSATAIDLMSSDTRLQRRLVQTYRDMSLGETYDLFIPSGEWRLNGYNRLVARKTSALFQFTLLAAWTKSSQRPESENWFAEVGCSLGELYQISNDYYDWQPRNLAKRRVSAQEWPITFSFPLATFLQWHGSSAIEKYLEARQLDRSQWERFLAIIWTDPVQTYCDREIDRRQNELLRKLSLSRLPSELKNTFKSFAQLITTEEFWYHPNEFDSH